MNKNIMKRIFPEAVENYENGICPLCKQKINPDEFVDELSKKEYDISGLCQECQNKVFEKDE